jgi:hypothetical protein
VPATFPGNSTGNGSAVPVPPRAVVADDEALADGRATAHPVLQDGGETFLPPEVTRMSFLRPVMVR